MPNRPLEGRAIRCILFDLGDTLWFRNRHAWEHLENAANQRAVTLLRECVASQLPAGMDDVALGWRLRESFNKHVRAMIRSNPEIEPQGALAARDALMQYGIGGIDILLGAAIFEALRVRVPESRPLFDDTLSTLAVLQQRGFLLGIVSNRIWGGQAFQEDLQTLGLHKYFDLRTIAVSGDLGVRKPNPAIFLHALDALNVSPEEAAMVGDALSADIVGAQRLGIFATWKPKSEVREHMHEVLLAGGTSQDVQQMPLESEIQSEETATPVPLPGMHVTDDDYILAQVKRDYLEQYLRGEITPDLIIERLSDLLDIFLEVGA
ncbi:MAG TPA: HAD family hydrolase [Ktedonobacteraceae bacterium]|nr:HAD family hydrolase [Ktedonobacteraceae bacterium]